MSLSAEDAENIRKNLSRVVPRQSPNDDRKYRVFELPNKLKVFLIHDAESDKAAAALNVNIGAIHDPDEFPGLAHFCEHMLFLGTEKYPVENEYGKYLSQHGGWSNAFTDSHDTNYHFEVGWKFLDGALDRFAQFFHKPLFTEDCTDREVNAVNSEHEKNFKQDSRRLYQLAKHTSDPAHPYSRFPSGNKKTLKDDPEANGLDTRAALLAFHEKYYSSNIMGLTIFGRDSLDDLEAMAVNMFSTIENKEVVSPTFHAHPNHGDYVSRLTKVVPVKELRSLRLSFPIKDQTFNFASQPSALISHLLGHEGKGSLLSYLKSKDWANGVMAGAFGGAVGSFSFFNIYIDMSETGLENVDTIVEVVYQYIAMLKSKPLERWVFDECKSLLDIEFRFQEKSSGSNVCTLRASQLRIFPSEQLMSADYDLVDFRPDLVSEILDTLTPSNMNMTLIHQGFADETNATEPYYGTPYHMQPLSAAQTKRWSEATPNERMSYPDANRFIATDFKIKPPPPPATSVLPQLLLDSPILKIWHKQDITFKLPKGRIGFVLTSPKAYLDPRHAVMTRLFVDVFRDSLTEFAYDAELAGVHSSVRHTTDGIDLTVSGYHDKLPAYLNTIVERLTSVRVEPERFLAIRDRYTRALRSFQSNEPISLAAFAMQQVLLHKSFTHDELQEACQQLTCDDIQNFLPVLLNRVHLECFVFGNFTEDDARQILAGVESRMQTVATGPALVPSERERTRCHQLESKSQMYCGDTDVHKICCVKMYMQVGLDNVQLNGRLTLLCQLIQERTFDVLRTKEQLGYNVYSTLWKSSGVRGLQISVQSNHSHEHVSKRIRAYIHSLKQFLVDMPDEVFSNHVEALSTLLLEKPKVMSAEARIYWTEIVQGFYLFDRRLLANDVITSLTKADMLAFYNKYLDQDSEDRCELLTIVHPSARQLAEKEKEAQEVAAQKKEQEASKEQASDAEVVEVEKKKKSTANAEEQAPEQEERQFEQTMAGTIQINDPVAFKSGLGLYPIARPQEHTLKEQLNAKADL